MREMLGKWRFWGLSLLFFSVMLSCQEGDDGMEDAEEPEEEQETDGVTLTATLSDGLYSQWQVGDVVRLSHGGQSVLVKTLEAGQTSKLSDKIEGPFTNADPLLGLFPADNASAWDKESVSVTIPATQTAGDNGFDEKSVMTVARTVADALSFHTVGGGLRLNFQLTGVTKIELESVDGYALAGTIQVKWDGEGLPVVNEITNAASIITFNAPTDEGFVVGKDYYISTLPCDLYGGYRLTIYKDGLAADYFGVHQTVERADYINPADLVDSELEFDNPDAPLVEEERPELDATTQALLRQYQSNPTEENKQALLEQMGVRYDKVVARKKAKLRELEREALTADVVEEMQAIVDEMVSNREVRLEQQFLRLIDPRTDDDPNDAWMVLRGASAPNAYIAYAPVTRREYAAFKSDYTYEAGKGNFPVVNISVDEAIAYCYWLTSQDSLHTYRLPTDEEWILGAGHMPKDVEMNAGFVENGLTAVDAYSQTTGACGGIDFWGNCWEWTTSTDANGLYVIKGGSWNSDRDYCRTEKSDDVRDGSQGYDNVGFRVVRVDS